MLLGSAASSSAVTRQEMEQARALAAKAWMRCANNGSDYLDPIQPASVADLESKLKAAEKENIKKFKSVAMATDYESWDRDRLAQYWSAVYLADPALKIENIGYAKKMAYNAVSAMKVAKPAEPEQQAAPEATAEQEATPQLPDPVTTPDEATPIVDDTDARLQATEDSLMNIQAEPTVREQSSDDGGTTLYIIILCVLVVAVIALVVYATKVFKKSGEEEDFEDSPTRRQPEPTHHTSVTINTPAATTTPTTDDSDLIANRNREIKGLSAENTELRREIDDYKAHIRMLKDKLAAYESATVAAVSEPVAPRRRPEPAPVQTEPASRQPQRQRRTIYLGRANRDGIFLRAERELNPDQSIFRLVSTDGLTGTFTVADDAEVENRIISDPAILDHAAVCTDSDSYNHDNVITERSGTAIFESGRWRVLRKAQVKLV